MSHLDEGMLHTLLDGEATAEQATAWRAHLAACPACASRLAEEAALRVRAQTALDAVVPDPIVVAVPTGRGRRWRAPLAWAATIAVAVGAGWLLRGAWPGAPAAAPEGEGAAKAIASARAPAAPVTEMAAPTASVPPDGRAVPAPAPAARDRAVPAAPPADAAGRKQERQAAADVAAAPAPAAGAAAPVAQNTAAERARVEAASGVRAAEAPARRANADVDAAARALGGSLRRLEGATLAGVATEEGAAVSRWQLADGVVVVLRQEMQRGLAPGDTLLREADRRASARWRDGDYELTLEGPLPADSLLRLARRVH